MPFPVVFPAQEVGFEDFFALNSRQHDSVVPPVVDTPDEQITRQSDWNRLDSYLLILSPPVLANRFGERKFLKAVVIWEVVEKYEPINGILTLLAVLMIILAFVPAYFIGYLYFGLVAVYLALLYVVEKREHKRLSMIISYLFGLVVLYLVMKKAEKWDVRLFALVVILGALSLIRRGKNEGSTDSKCG